VSQALARAWLGREFLLGFSEAHADSARQAPDRRDFD
jgi:hypothetical protein